MDFIEKTSMDCSLVPTTVHRAFKQSQRKLLLLLIGTIRKVFSLDGFSLHGIYLDFYISLIVRLL